MCREMCLVLVTALFSGGCGRKSTPPPGFKRMTLIFQMDKAFLGQACVGSKVAAVVTDFVPTRQGAVAGTIWGLKLVPAAGGHWSVRDMDFLPNQESADKYLATFREGEPDAKSVPL
jgi:hypothetical protein